MARISAKEVYDNRDVVSQIYSLKDSIEGFADEVAKAEQAATEATAAATEATDAAKDALETASRFSDEIDALSEATEKATATAAEAKTLANAAVADAQIKTLAASGNLYMKQGDGGEKATEIPIADATQAGLMNAQTFSAIGALDSRVSALEGKQSVVYVSFSSDDPTQAEITEKFTEAAGREPIKGDAADDIARALIYQYDGATWIKTQSVASKWTNTTAGLVVGTDSTGAAGTLFAEADGTGSVNGWDALTTKVSNNTTDIATNKTNIASVKLTADTAKAKNDEQDTEIAAIKVTVGSHSEEIAALDEAVEGKQSKLKTASVILSVNGWSNYSQTVSCDIVTADNIIWVAPADHGETYSGALVYASAQGNGTLTFNCSIVPDVPITVSIIAGD